MAVKTESNVKLEERVAELEKALDATKKANGELMEALMKERRLADALKRGHFGFVENMLS